MMRGEEVLFHMVDRIIAGKSPLTNDELNKR